MAGYYGKDYVSSDDENKQNDAASTPVDNTLYDYTQTQAADANNPFSSTNDTSADDSSTPTPEQAAPEQAQEPAPQNETERTAAAAEANANTHAAAEANSGMREVTSDEMNNIYTQTGVNSEEWAKLTSGKYDIQKLLGDTKPETQKYRDAINMYMGYAQSVQQAAQAPTTAPAQQPQATPQNQILPSAGGNYQADRIYDPSKTYGRQADGTYVFSNSARDLQNNLAREGYYHGAIDGYFGQQTQDALNAYLAEHGIKTEPEKGSDTLTQAAEEAPKAETPSNVQTAVQNTTTGSTASTNTNNPAVPTPNASSSKPAHDDAWYAEQYEKITGSAPRTDILSPERIRDFVNKELASRPATPEDEGYDAMLQQQALYEQAREQERLNEINANRDEAFTPKFINDLRNGKSVEQILGEGDKSYNRWIEDNWDDLSYTYNLGSEFPTDNKGAEQSALYSELEEAYRNSTVDKNGRTGESQAGDSMSRALENRKVPEDFSGYTEPFVDAAGRQNQIDAINARGRSMDTYYRDMLDSMQSQPVERQSMTGNSMSEALENRQPDRLMPRGYATPANESLAGNSFSAALGNAVSAPDTNIFRQDMEELQGEMASDDIQSTGSSTEPESSDEQAMLEAYEAAMQSAQRARDIFSGLPTTQAEEMQQAREQWQQNMRTALEDTFNNPYMQQFRKDFEDVQRQFPNYSYSALADMVLFNEEMRNGQSSYYKWLTSQL